MHIYHLEISSPYTYIYIILAHAGHIDYVFPVSVEELDGKVDKVQIVKEKSAKRWKDIMQKNLNPKCRQFQREILKS